MNIKVTGCDAVFGELPCVAVFLDCVIAVVELTIMVTRALIRENTAITLWWTREEDTKKTLIINEIMIQT